MRYIVKSEQSKHICIDLTLVGGVIVFLSVMAQIIFNYKDVISHRWTYHSGRASMGLGDVASGFHETLDKWRRIGSESEFDLAGMQCDLFDNTAFESDNVVIAGGQVRWLVKCRSTSTDDVKIIISTGNAKASSIVDLNECFENDRSLIAFRRVKYCFFDASVPVDSAAISISLQSPSITKPLVMATYAVRNICRRNETGNWLSYDGGQTYPEWHPQSCWLPETVPRTFENYRFYFIGNSHIRNLFRCTTDEYSEHKSWKNSNLFASHQCTARDDSDFHKRSHCFSCLNMFPTHGIDYWFNSYLNNIKMYFYWNVVWDVPSSVRNECSHSEFTSDKTEIACMLKKSHGNEFEYVRGNIGFDVLMTTLKSQMDEDHDLSKVLVFNFASSYNSMETARRLLKYLQQPKFAETKVLFIVDPFASNVETKELLSMLSASRVNVIDLRSVFESYPGDPIPKNVLVNHVDSNCQKVLVKTILANALD